MNSFNLKGSAEALGSKFQMARVSFRTPTLHERLSMKRKREKGMKLELKRKRKMKRIQCRDEDAFVIFLFPMGNGCFFPACEAITFAFILATRHNTISTFPRHSVFLRLRETRGSWQKIPYVPISSYEHRKKKVTLNTRQHDVRARNCACT